MISIIQETIRKLNNQNSVTPDSMEEGSGKTHDPVRSEWSPDTISGSNEAAKICTVTSAVSALTLFPVITFSPNTMENSVQQSPRFKPKLSFPRHRHKQGKMVLESHQLIRIHK